jgi:hypothetical protein|tara:strand:+ start:67 stop:315 length:249 start_codon:yes stop_codon:yes gene_type:complete
VQKNLSKWIWFVNRQLNGSSRNNQFGEPYMKKRKEPARKTSVYLTKNNIEIIKGIQERYDLPVNRTINMCLTKYLPEMRVWI